MDRPLKLGVRELVEFCCRSGDLGGDNGPGVKAIDGLLSHQKIQKRYRHEAQSEYAIKYTHNLDGYAVELGGRIDLLFDKENPPRVEELKTVYRHRDANNHALHWAQLKCYAACYAAEQNIEQVGLSLNLVSLFDLKEQREQQVSSRTELESFLLDCLQRYLQWHHLVEQQRQTTREHAQAMTFPFAEFRQQQHRLAAEVYRATQKQQRLIVEAPTGSGKTISTLFPAVKAIGEDLCDQIVFLSAKVSGQNQAVNAIELMIKQGLDISYLVIQAKSRCCPCNSDPDIIDPDGRCVRCLGFFDRLAAARESLFNSRRLNTEQIQSCAREFELCPFELSLQMLEWVDVIICDFNYVFDPLVQLGYFKNNSRRKLLLVDELHNLVDRARGMYSATLNRRQIKKAMNADNSNAVSSALQAMLQAMDKSMRAQPDDLQISNELPDALLQSSYRFSEKAGFDIFSDRHVPSETLEFAREIFRFQCIGQLYGAHHKTISNKPIDERELKLLCLNAFEYLRDCYPMFNAVCGFSATLSPADYFKQALGMQQDGISLSLPSGFPAENLQVSIASHIDTRYQQRDFHIDAICACVSNCYQARPGNYLVFFSSYLFMQKVFQRFNELHPDVNAMIQQRDIDEPQQQAFLARFFQLDNQLGFAIMGGRFAEGIDFPGEALIGAILVGVGLPQANDQQKLIQQDFDAMQLDGFDYAFRFPGLIRVMQSAGRVIRSETDRGIILLIDRRFQQTGYRQLLPAHWQPVSCQSIEAVKLRLDEFWLGCD